MQPTDSDKPSTGYDASDPKQVAEKKTKKGRDEKSAQEAFVKIMSYPAGRALIWGLLSTCHLYSTTFDQSPSTMAFREGERNVGLRIMSMISRWAPKEYVEMMKENANDRS
jgi:hypothetical protein